MLDISVLHSMILCLLLQASLLQRKAFTQFLPIPPINTEIPPAHCSWDRQTYTLNETFHPTFFAGDSLHKAICTLCTCQPSAKITCENISCPSLVGCRSKIRVDNCCDVCEDNLILPPVITTNTQAPTSSCVHRGITYHQGDEFHPSSLEGTNSTSPNPFCTTCRCNNGKLSCSDISSSCPPLNCSAELATTRIGSCCQYCKPTINSSVCVDAVTREPHFEGETWNPTYPGVGKLQCYNCTCINGQTICRQKTCPRYCPPHNETLADGLCCSHCIRIITDPAPTSPTNSTQPTTSSTPPTLISCDGFTHNVYLCNNSSMAIENTTSGIVTFHVWVQGLTKQTVNLTSEQFAMHVCKRDNSSNRGKVLERRVNGLKTKEQKRKKIEMCKVNCAEMVVKMLRPTLQCT